MGARGLSRARLRAESQTRTDSSAASAREFGTSSPGLSGHTLQPICAARFSITSKNFHATLFRRAVASLGPWSYPVREPQTGRLVGLKRQTAFLRATEHEARPWGVVTEAALSATFSTRFNHSSA